MTTMLTAHDHLMRLKLTIKPIRLAIASAMFSCALIVPAHANEDIAEINKLMRAGQHVAALQKTDAILAKHPNDAQMRFTKGLILAEQNRTAEAINIFRKLTEDFPDLPEPYNNLAVLYASQGDYDKARSTLDMAIKTNPAYATTLQNLGDVYAKLASQAYSKAFQVDRKEPADKTRLSLIHSFRGNVTGGTNPHTYVASNTQLPAQQDTSKVMPQLAPRQPAPDVTKPDASKHELPRQEVAKLEEKAGIKLEPPPEPKPQAKPAAPVAEPARPVKPEPPVVAHKPDEKQEKPAAKPAPEKNDATEKAILNALNGWADAWSNRDVKAYINYYSPSFKPAKGLSRKNWEEERAMRIKEKAHISVKVTGPQVKTDGKKATVRFRQAYTSNSLTVNSRKTLEFELRGNKWMITEEKTGS